MRIDPHNVAITSPLKQALLVGDIGRKLGGAYVLLAVSFIVAVITVWRM